MAVDCLVFGYDTEQEQLCVLLFKRRIAPFEGRWSLVGSLVDEGQSLDSTARDTLRKYTGLTDVYLDQLKAFGEVNRDPGGRVVSVLYWSLMQLEPTQKELVKRHEAQWFPVEELPNMIMDHEEMVKTGLSTLKEKARRTPLGFELLPRLFTLPTLRRLYEAIYQQPLDDRNFRKKILATGLCERLDKKDKTSSKKGAFLYQFNESKYQQLSETGWIMNLL